MNARSSLRNWRGLVLLAMVLVFANGCFDDESTTGPEPAEAPALPPTTALSFDFSFFQDPSTRMARTAESYENFWNAYVRAVVAGAITEALLAPPLAVFALAINTVPSPQDDGSWIWVFTWVDGAEEAQIRLRGKELSDGRVEWALRLSSTVEGWDQELWFDGETWSDGNAGEWTFYGFEDEGKPEVAMLQWGADANGNFLRLTDLNDNPGNAIEFREADPWSSFTFVDAATPADGWFVRWNETDGTGSLRAPDYNGGEEACWDGNQLDTECPVTPAL